MPGVHKRLHRIADKPAPGEPLRSVALRAPERRVARSASPDLSDRALIRAAEQNRSSRYAQDYKRYFLSFLHVILY
jgi:hypothetical protein